MWVAPWNEFPNRVFLLTPVSGAPVVTVDDATISGGNSGASTSVFTVRLSEVRSQTVTVRYTTADGTATAGSDYVPAGGALTFAPGEGQKTITVLVIGDRRGEPNETSWST